MSLTDSSHYGDDKFDIYNGDESRQKDYVQAEGNSFIRMMLQHRKLYQSSIDIKLTKKNDKEKLVYEREEELCTV